MTIGEKIYFLRKSTGLSQEEFAFRAGVSKQTVFKWENDIVTPKFNNIEKITREFGLSNDYFLSDESESVQSEEKSVRSSPEEGGRSKERKIRAVMLAISATVLFLMTCAVAVILGFSLSSGKDALTRVVIIDSEIVLWAVFVALLLAAILMLIASLYFFFSAKRDRDKR